MKRSFTKSWTVILTLLVLAFSAIGVTPAYAATLIVTNTDDAGAGSLRDTLASAAVGDTITFDPALTGGTIYLASTLTLSKDVTIDGSALAAHITVSGDSDNNGAGNVGVFVVSSSTITLNSLTIAKGNGNGSYGGGIYNTDGTLTVTNCTFSGNSTNYGGGIYNSGTLTVSNSAFSGNSAGNRGGGIYNDGDLTVTNSTFSSNSASNDGGGIINQSGTLTVSNSTFSGNSAGSQGSGIFNDGAMTVTNSTFSGNNAGNYGGGIYYAAGSLTVTNNTFSGNTAGTFGGGIYQAAGTLAVTNSTFSGNTTRYGGGIYQAAGALAVTNSTFSGNTATDGSGGGINNSGGILTVTNNTFSGNSAAVGCYWCSGYGSGIYNSGGTLNYNNTIIANSAGNYDCYNAGTIGDNYNNLVEDGSCAAALSGDPKLGALASNGGPTQTLALLVGSTAINAGDDTICTADPVNNLDQRGTARPQGSQCDIGAYEYASVNPIVTYIARANANPTSAASVDFTVSFFEPVVGVDAADFSLSTSGVSSASIGAVSGSGITWTVTVNTGSGNGTIRLNVKSSGTGITSVATGFPLSGGFTIGETYTTDKTRPTIDSFAVSSSSTSLNIPIAYCYASDNVGVAGYKITGSSTPPLAGDTGWSAGYPATYTVGANGSYSLYPWAKDTAGNVSAVFGSPASVTVDTTAPSVSSITRANTNPTSAANVDFTVTFSEPVTGVDTSDFTLTTTGVTGYSITNVAGAGPYTVTVNTGSGNGTIRLDALGTGITDIAGNPLSGGFTGGEVYTVNKMAPSVSSITRASASPTHLSSVNFTVTFSEPVTGVDTSDFTLTPTGVTDTFIMGMTGTGPYTVTVFTGTGMGTIRLDVNSSGTGITDAIGNSFSGGFTGGETYTIDKIAPSVSSIARASASPTNLASVNFTVTFSETVTGVDTADFALTPTSVTGASITGVTGIGPYTVTVNTGSGNGAIRLDVNPSGTGITDATGNPLSGGFTTGETYAIEKTAPSVSSITRASASPTNLASVNFTVTFSKPVTGVDTADFILTTTGVTGASITGMTGTGPYTVTVNTGTGNGTIRLDVKSSGTGITDALGNPLSGGFTGGETYTVSKAVTLNLSSSGAQDGWVLESSENGNVGGTLNSNATTFNLGDDATKKQYRSILSFSTGALPDNVNINITSVTLNIKKSAIVGGGNPVAIFRGFMVDMKKGFFGATTALQSGDFQAGYSKSYGPFNTILAGGWYSINLTSAKGDINTLATNGGLTQIRLRFNLDDNNNAIANYLSLFSGNAPATSRPQLVIQYYAP